MAQKYPPFSQSRSYVQAHRASVKGLLQAKTAQKSQPPAGQTDIIKQAGETTGKKKQNRIWRIKKCPLYIRHAGKHTVNLKKNNNKQKKPKLITAPESPPGD